LRFDLDEALRRLTACSGGRKSLEANPAKTLGPASRRRRRSGTNVELLPIRGRS
jgi:hypothetical protein